MENWEYTINHAFYFLYSRNELIYVQFIGMEAF